MITMYRDPKGTSVFVKRRNSDASNEQSTAVTSIYDHDVDSLKVKIQVLERKISQYEVC